MAPTSPKPADVTFRYPAKFVPLPEQDDILSIAVAHWLISLLSRVDGLKVESELCQDDQVVVLKHAYTFDANTLHEVLL